MIELVRLDDRLEKIRKLGYLLSFNFNKKKEIGIKEFQIEGKTIIEAVV